MAEIFYKTTLHRTTISKVLVEKSTEKSVWIKQYDISGKFMHTDRLSRFSEYQQYHDTWEDAHKHLLLVWNGKLKHSMAQVDSDREKLSQVLDLMKPEND